MGGGDGYVGRTALLHVGVANHFSPHLEGIACEAIFARGLLVFPIFACKQTPRPAVAVLPVKAALEGIVPAIVVALGVVLDQHVRPCFVVALF